MAYMIYTKPGCGFCDRAKELFRESQIHYEETVFETPQQVAAFKEMGFDTFPQIWDGTWHVGGYSDLLVYLDEDI